VEARLRNVIRAQSIRAVAETARPLRSTDGKQMQNRRYTIATVAGDRPERQVVEFMYPS
jgi:hypothetical protein